MPRMKAAMAGLLVMEREGVAHAFGVPGAADRAYGLTAQERNVAEAVCRGLSTREIALRLRITSNTLQDHLKVIFDKTGVRSRRELTATILRQQYLPRAKANSPLDAAGGFS